MKSQNFYQHHLPSGTIISDYQIESVLGEGGFGVTYLATDLNLGKQYAIKEYLPVEFAVRSENTKVVVKSEAESENYQWGMERFLDEARALASFNHKNINEVHRFFKANGTAYMVLKFIEGETLSALLKRKKQIPQDELQAMLTAILNGLAVVHKAGYTHRDIKPGNIMLASNGTPVLIDFGAARQAMGYKSKSITTILTPGYAPVEQYDTNADDIGPWTDFYALGMVAYRCLTGCADKDLSESVARSRLLQKGLKDEKMLPAVEVGQSGYSKNFLRAVDSAIEVLETKRPQSVTALLDQFELGNISSPEVGIIADSPPKLGHKNPVTAKSPPPLIKSSKPPLLIVGGGILVLLAVIFYLVAGNSHKQSPPIASTISSSTAQATLEVRPTPVNATIRILNIKPLYRPGMALKPGRYHIEVSAIGYQTRDEWIALGEGEKLTPAFRLTAKDKSSQLSPDELVAMGEDFYFGDNGSPQDYTLAAKWFIIAAEQGHVIAQSYVGFIYEKGEGITKDAAQAIKWYRKAAEQGNADAQFNLGVMYADGTDIPKDAPQAVKWYRKAAEQGNAAAQFNLGNMYAKGRGVAKNATQAVKWYRKAAEQRYAAAQLNLGIMYENGTGLAKDTDQAVKWYRKAAEQGNVDAQYNLGGMYANGSGLPKNSAQAVQWFRKAAQQGDADAQFNMGVMCANGRGIAQDTTQAMKWYRKAAQQRHTSAQYNLGVMYENGSGVTRSKTMAISWYRKAAAAGSEAAKNNLKRLSK